MSDKSILVKGLIYQVIDNRRYNYSFYGIYLGKDVSNKHYFENKKGLIECVSYSDFTCILLKANL
jgi:hypothetical protein